MLTKVQSLLWRWVTIGAVMLLAGLCPVAAQKTATDKEVLIAQIKSVEQAFQDDLKRDGAAAAFYKYAAPHAVIKREEDTLIKGADAIKNYYANRAYKNAVASWSPDFIDVADDGSLAYTYGTYKWVFTDESGKQTTYEGVFHTVWKRMKDGTWKYVWD